MPRTAKLRWSEAASLDWLYYLIDDPCERDDLDRSIQEKVRARQSRAVARMTPTVMIGKFSCAVALGIVLVSSGQMAPWFAVWTVFAMAMSAHGFATWYTRRNRPYPDAIPRDRRNRVVFSCALIALVWAIPGLTFLPATTGTTQAFVLIVSVGMIAGGALSLYAMPAAAILYCGIVAAGALIGLGFSGDSSVVGYLIIALAFVYVVGKSIIRHSEIFVSEFVARMELDAKNAQIKQLLEQAESAADTERRRSEMRLAKAQKMEAIGQLTGGIAHDFNNLLAAIQGNTELLELEGKADASLTAPILQSTRRGSDLVHRLLSFARKQVLRPRSVHAGDLVDQMQTLLRRTLGADIEIETQIEPDLWPVHVDPGQLEAAVLNLAVNAREALRPGGKLLISCENLNARNSSALSELGVTAGDFVSIRVEDNGNGMSPRTRDRAIDPFFTTKSVGEGSGLGLSTVYGFVRQSGGHLRIDSSLGVGTTITLFLPRLPEGLRAAGQTPADTAMPVGLGQRVLVVEDDASVARMVGDMLISLNYKVMIAGDSAEAMAILMTSQKLDLVLSDVVLPGDTNGSRLADQISDTHPALPVRFMSGFASRNGPNGPIPEERLLVKPFDRRKLADFVGAVFVT